MHMCIHLPAFGFQKRLGHARRKCAAGSVQTSVRTVLVILEPQSNTFQYSEFNIGIFGIKNITINMEVCPKWRIVIHFMLHPLIITQQRHW